MYKKIIIVASVSFLMVTSCVKNQNNIVKNNTLSNSTRETNFDPKSADNAAFKVKEFISHTEFSKLKETRSGMPNTAIDEGVWLLEGGANYLKNPNYREYFNHNANFTYTIQKLTANTFAGSELENLFSTLINDINAHELSSVTKANLINGFIVSENNTEVNIKFDVYFGEPFGNNELTYTYPTADQSPCNAASILTTGINTSLQFGTQFATSITTYNCNQASYTNTFNSTRIWKATTTNNLFFASLFPTYHQGGIDVANVVVSQNSTTPPNVYLQPALISVQLICDLVVGSGPTALHRLTSVSTAGYLASY